MWRAAAAAGVLAGLSLSASGAARADGADQPTMRGFAFGAAGETIFEHTRASLRDPHFGIRLYTDSKVPGTLSTVPDPSSPDADARAAAAGGRHVFIDVAFGERAPLVGWYDVHPTRSVRHARGVQLNLDAAAFLLLDFKAQSEALIDSDYRIGTSLDLPPPGSTGSTACPCRSASSIRARTSPTSTSSPPTRSRPWGRPR